MKMLTAILNNGLSINIALEGKNIPVIAEIFEGSDKIRSFRIHSDNCKYHHPHEFGLEEVSKCYNPSENPRYWNRA